MGPLTLLVAGNPAERALSLLERLPADTRIAVSENPAAFGKLAGEADAILDAWSAPGVLEEVFAMCPRVRWVHSLTAGVESILFPALVANPVPLTNSRGVFSRSLAEFAVAAILYFAKDFRRMIRSQAAGVWDRFDIEEVHGRTLAILGFGEIGRRTARLASALGMRVTALRRHPDRGTSTEEDVRIYPPASLLQFLVGADYLVISAPLTAETRGMIGETELRLMKPTAVVINIGRGPVVREEALIRALEQHWIRGAALDVFDSEPLPDGHPFYKLKNVLLSAHCADHTVDWKELAMQFFIANFERFQRGEPLANVVDKQLGY
jgi:phosphoglycerate dehydrogenase-like enzyme